MTPAPKRRWFRFAFSLRTLFIVVTVFGCWLGYSLNWIKQRHAFIADEVLVRERHPTHDTWSASLAGRSKTPPRAPGMLWIFGEDGWSSLEVLAEAVTVDELTDHDWDRIMEARSLFPEAKIGTVHVWDTPEESGVAGATPPDVRPVANNRHR